MARTTPDANYREASPKHERRFTSFDDKIVAMYARGMVVRETRGFLAEQYGTNLFGILCARHTMTD